MTYQAAKLSKFSTKKKNANVQIKSLCNQNMLTKIKPGLTTF